MSDDQNRPTGGRSLPGGTARFAPGSNDEQMERFGTNSHRQSRGGESSPRDSGEFDRSGSEGVPRGGRDGSERPVGGNREDDSLGNQGVRDGSEGRSEGVGRSDGAGRSEGSRRQEDANNSRVGNGSGDRGNRGNRGNRGQSNGSSGSGNQSSRSSNKKKGNGKLKDGLTSWMPWVFIIVLIGFSYVNSFGVPFVYDRNVEENLNLFVTEVENDSVFPFGEVEREKTGVDRIAPDMVYHMGVPRYYVFVYDETSDPKRYEEFSKAVDEYKSLEDIPIFKLSAYDADKNGFYEFSAGSPQVIELTRIGDEGESVVTKNYYIVSDWKADWLDYSGDRKWYDKLLGR